jgi:AmpE protein
MKFIVILLIAAVNRYWIGTNPFHHRNWFAEYRAWFSRQKLARRMLPNSRFLLMVGAPVIAVLLLFWIMEDWLWGLAWMAASLVVLGYSVGLSLAESRLQDHLQWLRTLKTGDPLEEAQNYHQDFQEEMIYDDFESLYPVFFWFILAGPAGAVLYRMTRQYMTCLENEESDSAFVRSFIHFFDWLPSRITTLFFTLVGDFASSIRLCVISISQWQDQAKEVLGDTASAALGTPDVEHSEIRQFILTAERQVFLLRDLLNRTLICWIGLIAILALLGVL